MHIQTRIKDFWGGRNLCLIPTFQNNGGRSTGRTNGGVKKICLSSALVWTKQIKWGVENKLRIIWVQLTVVVSPLDSCWHDKLSQSRCSSGHFTCWASRDCACKPVVPTVWRKRCLWRRQKPRTDPRLLKPRVVARNKGLEHKTNTVY